MLGPKGSWNTTVIPDSEDERKNTVDKSSSDDVIEIPTDSSDEENSRPAGRAGEAKPTGPWDYRSAKKPMTSVLSSLRAPSTSPRKALKTGYMRSRVVESSESESEDGPAPHPRRPSTSREQMIERPAPAEGPKRTPAFQFLKKQSSSMVVEVESESGDDKDAILVFDEPPSARKPLRKPKPAATVEEGSTNGTGIEPPTKSRDVFDAPDTKPESETPEKAAVPKRAPRKRTAGTPRVTSKKQKEEEQRALHTYAASFFDEVNRTVFKLGLPEDTKLNWNKRLLTTAGRAKWHRSRDGTQTSEIELAEKILTSRERIRNTLSHEMCHLASWVIDKEIKEAHGRIWKAWTRKVMRKYPDIDISTRHDYEIEYPYKWKCAKCDKIYGRFSKSIKPDECVCGACREGRLIPQFATATRAAQTPKMSRMAAAKPQDSPLTPTKRAEPRPSGTPTVGEIICISSGSEDEVEEPVPPHRRGRASICEIEDSSDSEAEIRALVSTLIGTAIVE